MKPLFQWVRNNVALSFFFTTELICFFYAFTLVLVPTDRMAKK